MYYGRLPGFLAARHPDCLAGIITKKKQTNKNKKLHMAHFQLGSFLTGLASDWARF